MVFGVPAVGLGVGGRVAAGAGRSAVGERAGLLSLRQQEAEAGQASEVERTRERGSRQPHQNARAGNRKAEA
jgi:hypothetical protein